MGLAAFIVTAAFGRLAIGATVGLRLQMRGASDAQRLFGRVRG